MKKLILLLMSILLVHTCFAMNDDYQTSDVYWLQMPNGQPYNIATDGGYPLVAQFYDFEPNSNFNLNIIARDNQGTQRAVIQITDIQFRTMVNNAFDLINGRVGSDFARPTSAVGRAITILVRDNMSPETETNAQAFAPRGSLDPLLYPYLSPVLQAVYRQYGDTGAVTFNRTVIQDGWINYDTFGNFVATGVMPNSTTIQQYTEWMLQEMITHEVYHLFGGVHIDAFTASTEIRNIIRIAGQGELLYPRLPTGLANFMPSILTYTPINVGGYILSVGAHYFYALHNYLRRPVTGNDIDLAMQDTNLFACANQYSPNNQFKKIQANTSTLCPVTETISVGSKNGVTGLFTIIVGNDGYPILYPRYINNFSAAI